MSPENLVAHVRAAYSRKGPFKPFAYHDLDGDCIEFFVSNEPFTAQRVDSWLTVYHGDHSQKIIGSLIKGVSRLLSQHPGLVVIDVECGHVRLAHILRARAWSVGDEITLKSYKGIIEVAEQQSVVAELQPA
ncbi:MAG: hypothetical protein AMXMBFR13_19560 [Phycisphaerae bacterium]